MAEDLLQAAKETAERRHELPAGGDWRSETRDEFKNTSAATRKNLSIQCLRGIAALFVALYHASVYDLWPSSSGASAASLSAIAAALIVSAGFGMLDIRMYRYFRNAVDNAAEEQRRRRVNIYAGAFVAASLAWL